MTNDEQNKTEKLLKPAKTLEMRLDGTNWSILFLKQKDMPVDNDGDAFDGMTLYSTQQIYINNGLHPHRKAIALTHEMLHVLLESYNFRNEEKIFLGLERPIS